MDFNILECRRLLQPNAEPSPKRLIHNYEIDYYLKGPRTLTLDDQSYSIHDGSISIKRPGQIASSTGEYYDCYTLTIDFSQTTPLSNYFRGSANIIEPLCENVLLDALPAEFVPIHRNDIIAIFSSLSSLPDQNTEEALLLANQLLFLLNSDYMHQRYLMARTARTPVELTAQFICDNFHQQLTVSDLANHVHLEKSYLIRIFKKQYGITPIEYAITQRLKYACTLLEKTSMTINEISDACGYRAVSFFVTQFKKNMHITPSQYRLRMVIREEPAAHKNA